MTGVDVVVSWNFRHLVNLKVKQRLPVILAQGRYLRHFDIISPYEFSEIKMAEQKLQQDQVKVTRSWMKSVGLEKRLESSARS
ncbi:MAG TPA: hypothetical protein EYO33_21990 [Phycisphaerales bacterium]|nr:hypothetical protein [Phycisphaerales bacterium]